MNCAPIGISLAVLTCTLGITSEDASPQDESQIALRRSTGSNSVGTTVWRWIDSDRRDELRADSSDVREIMAHAWRPAVPDAA